MTVSMQTPRAFLVALARALSARRLYGPSHARTLESVATVLDAAEALLSEARRPRFSFLGSEVIYGDHPLRDPGPAGWTERLSEAGVQRVELRGLPTAPEVDAFLASLEEALGGPGAGSPGGAGGSGGAGSAGGLPGLERGSDAAEAEGPAALVWGALRSRDGEAREGVQALTESTPGAGRLPEGPGPTPPELGPELEAAEWIWKEVEAGRSLPLAEGVAVIRSLGVVLRDLPARSAPRILDEGDWAYGAFHAVHTALLAMAWARELGAPPRELSDLGMAAFLHDIGLARVAAQGAFEHEGPLSEDERARLENHPQEGARLLLATDANLSLAAVVAFEHHLLPGGGGYPATSQVGVPHPAARLVQLLSSYTALRSPRPHRQPRSPEAAREVIRSQAGRAFDASFVEDFERFDVEVPAVATRSARAEGRQPSARQASR